MSPRPDVKRVCLAYSGGLDTSVILRWLIEEYDCEVVAYCADVGQEEELDGLPEKARATGAVDCVIRDVREDIEDAADSGKRLVLMVEQRGCIYCKKMHEEVYTDPKLAAYIAENFMVVQYNMFGDEEVTDLDGEALPEKEMVRRWRVLFTPTVIFLPEEAPEDGVAIDAAVAVMPGAFSKNTALHMFEFVKDKVYETDEPFQKYHARRLDERRAAGEL